MISNDKINVNAQRVAMHLTKFPYKLFSGFLDLQTNKSVLKMEENEWVPQIQEQYLLGINHVLDYIQTEAYRM